MPDSTHPAEPSAKQALRERITTHRAQLDAHDLAVAARALRDIVLEVPEVAAARRVAAYVSVGREPGTGPLIEALSELDVEVLLPVLQPDLDLDWARYEGPSALGAAPRGLLEPTGGTLGPGALADTEVVIVPALAVDRRGARLGRGGGSYDRALARLGGRAFVVALLHDGELLDMPVPSETHDVPVHAAATPSGFADFRRLLR